MYFFICYATLNNTNLTSCNFELCNIFWGRSRHCCIYRYFQCFFTNFQAPSGTGFIRFMCNGHWNFITWITRHQLQILKCHSTHDSPIFAAFSPGGFRSMLWKIAFCISNKNNIAESFYDVKNGSSIITSKSSSKNLSINENKHWCFCCLQDKMWIKMPKMNYFFNIIKSVCFDSWDFLMNFLT